MITTQEARRIASFYASASPEGQTFRALSEGRRVPTTTAAAAIEFELMQTPGVQELEDLQEWIWS